MAKKLEDYVPEKPEEIQLVQAKCDKKLVEAVIAKKGKMTWVDFMEASMRRYLEEHKSTR
jgi:hypothetical protein